jgi:uncharacterized membrane protein
MKRPLSSRRFEWLRAESERWSAAGVITPEQARGILDRYEPGSFGRHAAPFAIWALAILMAAVGLLLVIGYNWDQMPRIAKATLVFGAVAGAFAGSMFAYSRQHPRAGELLGFLGVLLYGNAIWLLAQVYHISGHYPDGMMWWMLGALLTAHLLESPLITGLALALLAMWVWAEGIGFGADTPLYVLFAAAALRLVYRFQLRILLAAWSAVLLVWLGVQTLSSWQMWAPVAAGLTFVAGAVAYVTGLLHRDDSPLRPTWIRTGASYMLIGLVPLMIKSFDQGAPPEPGGLRWPAVAFALLLLAGAWVAAWRRSVVALAAPALGSAVLVAAGVALLAIASRETELSDARSLWFALAFSAIALALAAALLRAGIRMDDLRLFTIAVLFALSFLVVRWIDLLGNMLWSAVILFAGAAGLVMLGRLWRARPALSHPGDR